MDKLIPGSRSKNSDWLTDLQCQARREWQDLCFTLQSMRYVSLLEQDADRYCFAKAFEKIDSEHSLQSEKYRQRILLGDYTFFSRRGVASEAMSLEFALLLLRDWRRSIEFIKYRAEDWFERRYGEDMIVFLRTPRNASRLEAAKNVLVRDPIVQLSHFSRESTDLISDPSST